MFEVIITFNKSYISEMLNRPKYNCRIWADIHPTGKQNKKNSYI